VGPDGAAGFAWPGTVRGEPAHDPRIEEWTAAQRLLESRAGRPFDEVFVVGFSSGAYFATTLALGDRFHADGYALLAGGTASVVPGDVAHRAPIFVGVSARDRATAAASRALGRALASAGWPVRVDEQPIGHMVHDVHVAHALAYLRSRVGADTATGTR
jgi:predicted esterase